MDYSLYEVKNVGRSTFYVVAKNQHEAAEAAEKAWAGWGYLSSEGKVLSVILLAEARQYKTEGTDYLLLMNSKKYTGADQ